MATINELLKGSAGTFINLLLPTLQEAVALNDPYINYELAKAIYDKQIVWGGGTVYENKSSYPLANIKPIHTDRLNTAIVQNFLKKLNNPPMSVSNAWLDFQKFVDLFYQMIDPITFFRLEEFECPPDLEPCQDVLNNFYLQNMGLYERPLTSIGTEGTGFSIANPVIGSLSVKHEVEIGFRAPYPFTDPHALALNNRYFAMNYDAASDNWDVIWYDYEGSGVQPTFVAGGVVNYIPVALGEEDEWPSIQAKTVIAVEGTTRWVSIHACPPGVGCLKEYSNTFQADVVGSRQDTIDGTGGYLTPVTTMMASDNTVIATGLVSDTAWQNAHNGIRVPYEKLTFDRDYMYLKSVSDLGDNGGKPCCEEVGACKACFIFIQTIGIAVIEDLPINAPGVLNNNAAGNNRLLVID